MYKSTCMYVHPKQAFKVRYDQSLHVGFYSSFLNYWFIINNCKIHVVMNLFHMDAVADEAKRLDILKYIMTITLNIFRKILDRRTRLKL